MQNKQYELCQAVLHRLRDAGVLERLILVGSWCLVLYKDYFRGVGHVHAVRTRDMDFLVADPARRGKAVNIPEILEDLGFLKSYRGTEGYMMLEHPELMIEFLVPERGRGESGARNIPELGVNAQPLRFMDIPSMLPVDLPFGDVMVRAPHPAAYALHKLLIAHRRPKGAKMRKDIVDALSVLDLLVKKNEATAVKNLVAQFPVSWRKTIREVLHKEQWEHAQALLG